MGKKSMALGFVLAIAMCMMSCGSTGADQDTEQSRTGMAAESGSENASTTEGGNLISEYMDKGYTWREYSTDNNELVAVMGAADNSDFVKITIPITDDEVTVYGTIDVFDEQYNGLLLF